MTRAIASMTAPFESMLVPDADDTTKSGVTNSVARDAMRTRTRTIVHSARTTADYNGGLCWIRTSDLCDVNAAL